MNHDHHAKKHGRHAVITAWSWLYFAMIMARPWQGSHVFPAQGEATIFHDMLHLKYSAGFSCFFCLLGKVKLFVIRAHGILYCLLFAVPHFHILEQKSHPINCSGFLLNCTSFSSCTIGHMSIEVPSMNYFTSYAVEIVIGEPWHIKVWYFDIFFSTWKGGARFLSIFSNFHQQSLLGAFLRFAHVAAWVLVLSCEFRWKCRVSHFF